MRSEPRRPRRRAFTLMELMVVLVIIGILMALILMASSGAAREAEARATQALVTRLENGLNDRVEAILAQRIDPITSHGDMAMIWANNLPLYTIPSTGATDYSKVASRAQVIALFDMYKAEIPDAFFVQTTGGGKGVQYALNFGSQQYPTASGGMFNYLLPIGVGSQPSTGIFGASYTAAAGLYQNLGNIPQAHGGVTPYPYLPAGADGADNNANGFVDDLAEGINATNSAAVTQSLTVHRHKTARAEMLYALLTNASSPFGSVFNPDDFTNREVMDTDGDGLPEFVDAWGEPLYFYRWPVFYHSDVQKGVDPNVAPNGIGPYNLGGVTETREQDPLDPNQYLMSPVWWSAAYNGGPAWFPSGSAAPYISGPAAAFQRFFHQITEPVAVPTTSNPGTFWDRGILPAYNQRRAYFTRFLIVSSGQDRQLGLPILTDTYIQSALSSPDTVSLALQLEGQAGQFDLPSRINYNSQGTPLNIMVNGNPVYSADGVTPLTQAAQDDIHNHNTQTTGGSTQ